LAKTFVTRLLDAGLLSLYLQRLGTWAPVAFILIASLRPLAIVVPGQLPSSIAGLLFGTLYGGVYTVISSFFSTLLVYAFARRFGPCLMQRAIKDKYPALHLAAQRHGF
jgi:uncharacterized membrane protein YdjX (TVP38/TMEM64 family)